MHDELIGNLNMVAGTFSIICFGWNMVVIGRNIAVVESGLLKREFGTTHVTTLMHRQTGFSSTSIAASGILLSLRLTVVLSGGLLWGRVSILRIFSAA